LFAVCPLDLSSQQAAVVFGLVVGHVRSNTGRFITLPVIPAMGKSMHAQPLLGAALAAKNRFHDLLLFRVIYGFTVCKKHGVFFADGPASLGDWGRVLSQVVGGYFMTVSEVPSKGCWFAEKVLVTSPARAFAAVLPCDDGRS
jgi:hypothetical protein